MVSINVEIPDAVFSQMMQQVESDRATSQDIFVAGALALFLMQKGVSDKAIARAYLDSIFGGIDRAN